MLSLSSSSSLCCVVVVMCGGFCGGWQGVFVFLTCDSCQLEFYVAVAWYNNREWKFNRKKRFWIFSWKIAKDITLWNQYFCCFNAHAEAVNPCSVETICIFWMPLYVDCGVLIVGKDLTSHLTDTFLVCVCRTYWESCQWKFNSNKEFLFSEDFIGRFDHM